MNTRRTLITRTLALMSAPLAWRVWAAEGDDYPSKPIKFIVPFAPGGSTDILSRILAKELGEELGFTVVVDNRAGAGSIVGTQAVARSPADGYTILMTGMPFSALPAVSPNLPFDPVADFLPIINLGSLPTILIVPTAVPAQTLQEYIAYVKKSPRPLNYSSAGIGSLNHLAAELFASLIGVEMTHIPYQSGGQAVSAMLSGDTDLLFTTIPPAIQHVQSGKLRAIAISHDTRSKVLPATPTFAEGGLPAFQSAYWQGLLAPAKTPAAIVTKLNAVTNKVLRSATMAPRMAELGIETGGGTPRQFGDLIKEDIQRYLKLAKAMGTKPK